MKDFKERFVIRDAEAGNPIDAYDDLSTTIKTLQNFINEDKKNKNYKPNFYEILDQKNREIFDENLNKKNFTSGIFSKKRRIYNCGIDNYIEEFDTEQEAINYFKKYNLDENYLIEKIF